MLWHRPSIVLGDPGAVSRVGRKGRTKVFKYGRKSPWVPTLTELFPKIQADAGSWLGTKNALYYCAQSANSFSWVLFVSSYTTAIVSITACLAHAPKKCTQSGNFQFDIKSPSDFKILSARKLKTLFQKYKLELTTGIHACIDHAFVNIRECNMPRQLTTTKTSHEEWTHIFSVSIVIIPTHLLCQIQANSSGAEFLSTISKFMKRMNFVIACLRPSQNVKLGIFTS